MSIVAVTWHSENASAGRADVEVDGEPINPCCP